MAAELSLDSIITDLVIRFFSKLPDEEIDNPNRLMYHMEQAYWLYIDEFSDVYKTLPKLSFKLFTQKMLKYMIGINSVHDGNNTTDKDDMQSSTSNVNYPDLRMHDSEKNNQKSVKTLSVFAPEFVPKSIINSIGIDKDVDEKDIEKQDRINSINPKDSNVEIITGITKSNTSEVVKLDINNQVVKSGGNNQVVELDIDNQVVKLDINNQVIKSNTNNEIIKTLIPGEQASSTKSKDTLAAKINSCTTKNLFGKITKYSTTIEAIANMCAEYRKYVRKVPVCGCILLTQDLKYCLVVKCWSKNVWNFPKGKINKDEKDVDCAIREMDEELGFDVSKLIDENLYFEDVPLIGRRSKMYIIKNIDKTILFRPRTRKEIGDIQWMPVTNIPYRKSKVTKYNRPIWPLTRFERKLRNWISAQRCGNRNYTGGYNNYYNSIYNGAYNHGYSNYNNNWFNGYNSNGAFNNFKNGYNYFSFGNRCVLPGKTS